MSVSLEGSTAASPTTKRSHPLSWVPTLYLAESLPFAAVNMVAVLMYRSLRGEFPTLTDGRIALFTALLGLPWSLKPFWSPFLELYRVKKHIALLTQVIGGALFAGMALALKAPPVIEISLVVFALLAFNSATHDIVADGIYLDSLSNADQAKYSGVQSAFWTLGSVLAQGALVWVAGRLEKSVGIRPAWLAVMGVLSLTMLLLAGYHSRMLPTGKLSTTTVANFAEARKKFRTVVDAFFLKRNLWWMIMFVLLYRFSEAQVTKMAQLFMRADRIDGGLGLSTENVGLIYGTIATIAFVGGSLAGGAYAAKVGLKKALPWLVMIFNVPNALFTFLAFATPTSLVIITTSATIEKFTLGFGQVALIVYMMQQVAPGKFRMAHYGFATALMNVGVQIPGMLSGTIKDAIGFKWFFVYVLVAAVPSFLVAFLVPFREIKEDDPEEDPERASRKPSLVGPLVLGSAIVAVVTVGVWLQLRPKPDDKAKKATAMLVAPRPISVATAG
jgi:PAT family beta-lactamase induction signal transducer AmpG